MRRTRKSWHLVPHDGHAAERLARDLGVSSVVAQLLLNRDVTTADTGRRFLESSLTNLHAPGLLPGISAAAERIAAAISAGRKICIYGDYDVDGVTGTAILLQLVKLLGGEAMFYVPHRLDEGYGLNLEAVRQLQKDGAELLVTVDCGITAVNEADEARALGLELIVTDHHKPGERLPRAAAIVHPRLPGSDYPFGELSGSGVAFKLAWAIAQRMSGSERVTPALREFLLDAVGLAALGLVADVVPLRQENRDLVRYGLSRLASHPPIGVRALLEAAGLNGNVIRSEDVSFKLAPRLNAAGRLGCARLVVELLTTNSPSRAKELAECLEGYNQQRQTLERRITTQARELVEQAGHDRDPIIVVGSLDWHAGVIGIVAGRLVELYGRPAVVIALNAGDEVSTGSGRSVPGFALHDALSACMSELVGSGGHAMAAGVKLRPSRLDEFRKRLVAFATERLPAGPPKPRLMLDAEVPLAALTFGLLRDIERLEPYGADNPRPLFLAAGLKVEGVPRRIGIGERHLSIRVRQGPITLRAIAFNMAERLDELMSASGDCCLAFTPRVNEWKGNRSIEIEVGDLAAGSQPDLA